MNQQLDPTASMVRKWISHAIEDHELIDHLLPELPRFSGSLLFHAQQAVEKYMKALLTWRGISFRKSHDLVYLGDLLRTSFPELRELIDQSKYLTEFAATPRYPDLDPEEEVPEVFELSVPSMLIVKQWKEALMVRIPAHIWPEDPR